MKFQLFAMMMQLIGAMIPMSGMMQIPGKKRLSFIKGLYLYSEEYFDNYDTMERRSFNG